MRWRILYAVKIFKFAFCTSDRPQSDLAPRVARRTRVELRPRRAAPPAAVLRLDRRLPFLPEERRKR